MEEKGNGVEWIFKNYKKRNENAKMYLLNNELKRHRKYNPLYTPIGKIHLYRYLKWYRLYYNTENKYI